MFESSWSVPNRSKNFCKQSTLRCIGGKCHATSFHSSSKHFRTSVCKNLHYCTAMYSILHNKIPDLQVLWVALAWHHFDGHFCPILWGHRQSMAHSPGQAAQLFAPIWPTCKCEQTPGPKCSQAIDHATGRGAWGLHICDYLVSHVSQHTPWSTVTLAS